MIIRRIVVVFIVMNNRIIIDNNSVLILYKVQYTVSIIKHHVFEVLRIAQRWCFKPLFHWVAPNQAPHCQNCSNCWTCQPLVRPPGHSTTADCGDPKCQPAMPAIPNVTWVCLKIGGPIRPQMSMVKGKILIIKIMVPNFQTHPFVELEHPLGYTTLEPFPAVKDSSPMVQKDRPQNWQVLDISTNIYTSYYIIYILYTYIYIWAHLGNHGNRGKPNIPLLAPPTHRHDAPGNGGNCWGP